MDLYEDLNKEIEGYYTIISKEETEKIILKIEKDFSFNSWGGINWTKKIKPLKIEFTELINGFTKNHNLDNDDKVYVVYNDGYAPTYFMSLGNFVEKASVIIDMPFDVYVYCVDKKYIIEFYHEGCITLGFSK